MEWYRILGLFLTGINIAGFVLMGVDKNKAVKGRWRIRENTLMAVALLGGAVGVYIGMYKFRHKTKHLKFVLGVPVLIVMQVVISIMVAGTLR